MLSCCSTDKWAQVLTKASLLAYERFHVARGIVERDWAGRTGHFAYRGKLEAAWHFDVISSGDAPPIGLLLAHILQGKAVGEMNINYCSDSVQAKCWVT